MEENNVFRKKRNYANFTDSTIPQDHPMWINRSENFIAFTRENTHGAITLIIRTMNEHKWRERRDRKKKKRKRKKNNRKLLMISKTDFEISSQSTTKGLLLFVYLHRDKGLEC